MGIAEDLERNYNAHMAFLKRAGECYEACDGINNPKKEIPAMVKALKGVCENICPCGHDPESSGSCAGCDIAPFVGRKK